jgi:hypothetical protein
MSDGKRTWREVASLRRLWALQAGPMTDALALTLVDLPLEILVCRRGSVSDLSFLSSFEKLTEFGAILCQELRDLSPLTDVPALTD